MTDGLSTLYQDLLGGSYDCVDRIVLNAYFRMGHDPGALLILKCRERADMVNAALLVKRRHRFSSNYLAREACTLL
jgi:hypothetical protein